MAYLAFDFAAGASAAPAAFARPAARFSATEWAVIHLARRDTPGSTKPASRLGAMVRRLFGLPAANRLADPRLEALRRAAVHCWHERRMLAADQVEALLAGGFGFDQIALLSTHANANATLR